MSTSPTATPGQPLIAILENPTGNYQTVHLLRPDGTEVNTLTLRPGVQLLTAAGQRIFLLEPGGVLKSISVDGTVETLGNLGSGPITGLIANADGGRWIWGSVDSPLPTDPTTKTPIASSLHTGGTGIPSRVIERLSDPNRVLKPFRWTPVGPIIGKLLYCCGLGSIPRPFPSYLFQQPDHFIDFDTGASTPLALPSDCAVFDVAADKTIACLGSAGTDNATLDLISANGTKLSVSIPLPQGSNGVYTGMAGDVYFSPDGSKVTVATSGVPPDQSPLPIFPYETYLVNRSDGSINRVALTGVVPAMFYLERSSWLPGGFLVVYREAGAQGGDPGTYVISPAGKVVKISSGGPAIAVVLDKQ